MEIVGECKRKKIGGPGPRVSQSFPVIKSSHSVVKTKKVNARGTVLVCNAISSSLAPYKKNLNLRDNSLPVAFFVATFDSVIVLGSSVRGRAFVIGGTTKPTITTK